MEDDENGAPPERPESLLPYDQWAEEALRHVLVDALTYAEAHGLPGEHHFYISFRTDWTGVSIPARLRAQYPSEMTIVLQHQFWDLTVEPARGQFSIGLSFGGIPSTLVVPFAAVVAFADPSVQFGLRFQPKGEPAANDPVDTAPLPDPGTPDAPPERAPGDTPQVVSLDAFRKRTPSKE